MSEPVQTTLEEASRCPKCKEPGVAAGQRPAPVGQGITRRAMLHQYKCTNTRCKWLNEVWLVQVNPDGTIPPPTTTRRNSLVPIYDDKGATRQRILDQLAVETQPGAELYH